MPTNGGAGLSDSVKGIIAKMSMIMENLEELENQNLAQMQSNTGRSRIQTIATLGSSINVDVVQSLLKNKCVMIWDEANGKVREDTYLSSDYYKQKIEISKILPKKTEPVTLTKRPEYLGDKVPTTPTKKGTFATSTRSEDRGIIRTKQQEVAIYREKLLNNTATSRDLANLKDSIKALTDKEREYQRNKRSAGLTNYNMERGNYGEMLADVYMYEHHGAIAIHQSRQKGYYDAIGKGIDGIYVSENGCGVYIADAKFGSSRLRRKSGEPDGVHYQMSRDWIQKNLTKALHEPDDSKKEKKSCTYRINDLIENNDENLKYILIHISYHGVVTEKTIIQSDTLSKCTVSDQVNVTWKEYEGP